MKVLITDGIAKEGAQILINAGLEVIQEKVPQELLPEIIKDYDAIMVRSATKVPKEVIDAGVKLKAIARGGVGLDNIDVAYAKEKGIAVLNTPGASSISVAELAIAHMISVGRFLHRSNVEMPQGKWPKKEYSAGREVTGKTLGLFGIGNIGRETAKRAIGLGMKVIATDPYITSVDLDVELVSKDELLKRADIISMHIPFIKAEGPAITKTEFDKMKDGVIVINCARGGVIKESDLLDALNSGKVALAGIDVWEQEPCGEEQRALIEHPNVSATPHIGASTNEAQDRVSIEIAERVVAALLS
ncbi:MAG: D-2-hydroxyacid dehydrogenase [bacterium]